MMHHDQVKTIAIIGGGITGLSTAYTIQKIAQAKGLPLTYTLFESSPRLGGKILSEQTRGFIIEGGPDSFLQQKPWGVELARELGLEDDLIGVNPEARKAFIAHQRRLVPMPDGMALITPTRLAPFAASPLLSWMGKLRAGLDIFIPGRDDDQDESVGQFVRRRFGQEMLDGIAEPLMAGIHAADPERLSLLATFPRLRTLEAQYESLIRGMRAQQNAPKGDSPQGKPGPESSAWQQSPFVSLRGGMGQLVQALAESLTGGQVLTGRAVTRLVPNKNGGYQVITGDHQVLEADAVVLASPAYVSADLTRSFAPSLADSLDAIPYVTTATVSLAFRISDIREPLPAASGFLVPRLEKRKILAGTFCSSKFDQRAPQGTLLIRCFLGGAGSEIAASGSDADIIETTRSELCVLLGIQAKPVLSRVFHWDKGNPQYEVGHLERVKKMQTQCAAYPGLFLAGSAYEGVGIPDCIQQGKQAAEKAVDSLPIGERHLPHPVTRA